MTMIIDGKEGESELLYEDIHPLDSIRFPSVARQLVDALDRMHGREHLSLNVRDAQNELRLLVEHHERDSSSANVRRTSLT